MRFDGDAKYIQISYLDGGASANALKAKLREVLAHDPLPAAVEDVLHVVQAYAKELQGKKHRAPVVTLRDLAVRVIHGDSDQASEAPGEAVARYDPVLHGVKGIKTVSMLSTALKQLHHLGAIVLGGGAPQTLEQQQRMHTAMEAAFSATPPATASEAPRLCDKVVLEPQWLANLMNSVVTVQPDRVPSLREQGTLRKADLPNLWRQLQVDASDYDDMLQLLYDFEVAYAVGDDILVPAMLKADEHMCAEEDMRKTKKRVDELVGAGDHELLLAYEMEFVPHDIMARLQARLAQKLRPTMLWRSGGLYKHNDDRATGLAEVWQPDNQRIQVR